MDKIYKNEEGEIKEKKFIITNYQLNYPHFIPPEFGNLYISESGLWNIKGKDNIEFEYVDASVLTQEDFKYVYYGNDRWNNLVENGFRIPKSFWYSKTYHYKNYKTRDIKNLKEELITYGKNVRLIREDEAMALIALDSSFRLEQGKLENLFSYDTKNNDFLIQTIGQIPDNWPILVSSIENPNVYRQLIPTLSIICDDKFAANSCVSIDYNKPYPYLVFPVFDENKDKVKKLSINS